MSVSKMLKNSRKNLAKREEAKSLPSKGEIRKMLAHEKASANNKPSFTHEEAERLKIEESTNVFILSNALYVLLERASTSLDNLLNLSRNKVGNKFSKEDALKVYYLENIIKAVTAGDEHMRKHHIKVVDGVSEMDNIHHLYHHILHEMDSTRRKDLDLTLLLKAAKTINSSEKYMWIDNESDFKNNMQLAIQYGIDLAIGGKRKKATLKDVDSFLGAKG